MPSLSGKDAKTLAQRELKHFLSEREKKMTRNNRDIMNKSSSSFNDDDDIQGMSRNTMGSQNSKEAMKGPVLRFSSSLVVGDLNSNDDNDGKRKKKTNIQRTSRNTMG